MASLGIGVLSLAWVNPAFAEEKLVRTITVTGRGSELVPTTLSQVRLGVEAQGKTAKEVQQQVAERSNAVVNLLRSHKVEKLETTGINLSPSYRYENNMQTLTGYMASNTVSFRVETQKAGTIMDDAVKAGATRIDGISFVAPESAIASAQKIALREATQEAQAQADAVLDALGLTKREIINIQINGASAPPPQTIRAEAFDAKNLAGATPTPVMGAEQQIEAFVTLQISY